MVYNNIDKGIRCIIIYEPPFCNSAHHGFVMILNILNCIGIRTKKSEAKNKLICQKKTDKILITKFDAN